MAMLVLLCTSTPSAIGVVGQLSLQSGTFGGTGGRIGCHDVSGLTIMEMAPDKSSSKIAASAVVRTRLPSRA